VSGTRAAFGTAWPYSSRSRWPGWCTQLIQGLIGRGRGDDDFAAALLQPEAASAGLELLSENADISDGLDPAGTNEERS
jgi:hypothetical protein